MIELLGKSSEFNKHIAVIVANDLNYKYMGVSSTDELHTFKSMERALQLELESVQLRVIEFVAYGT
jgi:hypothetical protein